MNERIEKLIVKTFFDASVDIPSDKIYTLNDYMLEKFAELIVRECVEACYNHKDVEKFGIYPVRVALVTQACADNIKEHFGVEE